MHMARRGEQNDMHMTGLNLVDKTLAVWGARLAFNIWDVVELMDADHIPTCARTLWHSSSCPISPVRPDSSRSAPPQFRLRELILSSLDLFLSLYAYCYL